MFLIFCLLGTAALATVGLGSVVLCLVALLGQSPAPPVVELLAGLTIVGALTALVRHSV